MATVTRGGVAAGPLFGSHGCASLEPPPFRLARDVGFLKFSGPQLPPPKVDSPGVDGI